MIAPNFGNEMWGFFNAIVGADNIVEMFTSDFPRVHLKRNLIHNL